MTNTTELKEEAESVAWWLDEKNSQARKELSQRRPELEAWLQMVERKVNEKLAEREAQEEATMKV